MTQPDHDPDDNDVRDASITDTTRRGALAALGLGGLAALGSGHATADLAGGPESDAMSEHRVPLYRVPENDLDSPGVVGRRVEITAGGSTYAAGDQLVDTGNSWERISAGVESLNTDDSVTVTTGEATDTLHYGSNQDRANAGDNSVALGIGARANGDDGAGGSIGNHVAVGYEAAENNTGNRVTASGFQAARGDGLADPTTMGDDNIGIGASAIRNNQASGLIAIGQEAGINAQTDDQLIITDRNGTRRMVMDLTNGNLNIDGTLTENATL